MKIVFNILAKGMFVLWLILLFPPQVVCQIPTGMLAWKFNSGEIYPAPLVVDSIAYIDDITGKFPAMNANAGRDIRSYTAGTQTEEIRSYTTQRLSTVKPVIDGKLDDACWTTGEWSGDFVQWIPKEGAAPAYPTFLKILYDDRNIYVAIRAFDGEPEKISQKAARRDELTGDVVGICFDSYHDHRTGFEFDLSAAGQKTDMVITNPMSGDKNWNAVWTAKTGLEDSAWVAEYEIPLSQLRYSSEEVQTWGVHSWRWIERLQEESDWDPQTSTGPGMLYLFGHLNGINNLPDSRRIEIIPYLSGKVNTFEKQAGNPFASDGNKWSGAGGFDAKIGLSSNFTADVAVNPDFGQVESDPSVMNLTAYETYYEEKRPFFLEGSNIFNYEFDDVNLFYSRRIGHAPTYYPSLGAGEYIDYPQNTSILSAVKISGKTPDGLSVGVLHSITNMENAGLYSDGETRKITVEPLTSYTVARVQQDFHEGTTVLGGILTSANRFLNEEKFNLMNHNALTGGLDLLHQWHDKEFFVETRLMGSFIQGDNQAIALLQQSPAHYFQRPDAGYLTDDTTLTALPGQGGSFRIGKGSKGLWRYSAGINWRSPGLDLNDMGFMHFADVINLESEISYFVNKPVSIFRTYKISINQKSNWDFGGNYLSTDMKFKTYFEFLNKWAINVNFGHTGESLDNRILRGGYAMKLPASTTFSGSFHTDYSGNLEVEFYYSLLKASDNSGEIMFAPQINFRPVNTLKFSFGTYYSENKDNLQYVNRVAVDGGNRYLLGRMDQKELGATFRIDYNITPELSIQYYGSPFASAGHYSAFKSVTNPKANGYADRFETLVSESVGDSFLLLESSGESYFISDPDFSFSQFRSNMVFRWEYRPGSQLYFVWSNERTASENVSAAKLHDAFSGLGDVFPNNLFLIKLSYWFSI